MLRSIRKSGTAALLAITMAMAAAVVAIVFSAQATAQPPLTVAPTAVTATAVPLPSLQCAAPSTNTFGFQPYLSLVTQPTTVQRTTAYRKCSTTAFPNIRSGYETRTFTIPDDCIIMLQAAGTSTFNIIWNTTQTSTLVLNRSASLSGNVFTVTFSGSVTAGLFAGRPARQIFTADATEINQCLAGTGVVPFIISDVTLTIY